VRALGAVQSALYRGSGAEIPAMSLEILEVRLEPLPHHGQEAYMAST
jgi:hypothetical protein